MMLSASIASVISRDDVPKADGTIVYVSNKAKETMLALRILLKILIHLETGKILQVFIK